MTLRIVIADDEPLARMRMVNLLTDIAPQCPHVIVGQTGNVAETLELIGREPLDCLLLDIQMPGASGMEVARFLKTQKLMGKHVPAVVFVTAFEQHALQAFDIAATDYLVKPIKAARLLEALERVPRTGGEKQEMITVTERGRIMRIPVDGVVYLKAELKYVTIRTREREFITEATLTSLEQKYADRFIRIHRNALVAKHLIEGVEKSMIPSEDGDAEQQWQVVLRGVTERLDVSRRQWPVVKALVKI
jgi:two-component system, LytTR family, response regulator AlgR